MKYLRVIIIIFVSFLFIVATTETKIGLGLIQSHGYIATMMHEGIFFLGGLVISLAFTISNMKK